MPVGLRSAPGLPVKISSEPPIATWDSQSGLAGAKDAAQVHAGLRALGVVKVIAAAGQRRSQPPRGMSLAAVPAKSVVLSGGLVMQIPLL
jgi:hypothetical protein